MELIVLDVLPNFPLQDQGRRYAPAQRTSAASLHHMPSSLSRMVYVDDSGDNQRGWMVYGWVEVDPAQWAVTLREWLEFRKRLWVDYGIPVHEELHTTQYAMGRDRISKNPPARFIHGPDVYWKDLGREVAVQVLEMIAGLPHVSLGAVARRTTARGGDYAAEMGDLYRDLVWEFDQGLKGSGNLMLLSMDGDGSNRAYFAAHRNLELDTRNIIEDPMFHDSKRSQWTQLADAVAYAAHAAVHAHAQNEFAWNWWSDWLAAKALRANPYSPPTAPIRT